VAAGPPNLLFTDGIPPTTCLVLVPVCDVVLINRAWWRVQTPAQRAQELRAFLLGERHEEDPPRYMRVRNPRAPDDWKQVAHAASALPLAWWDEVSHLPG
jgi:hypothetical protein